MATASVIRPFRDSDLPALRRCFVELHDTERAIDPRLAASESIADAYCAVLRLRCATTGGAIFVAEVDGGVAGFVAVQARTPYEDLDDPPGEYALVSDLVVLPPYRRRGLGRALLAAAEAHARKAGATEMRVEVLSRNADAHALYRATGFVSHLDVLAKALVP